MSEGTSSAGAHSIPAIVDDWLTLNDGKSVVTTADGIAMTLMPVDVSKLLKQPYDGPMPLLTSIQPEQRAIQYLRENRTSYNVARMEEIMCTNALAHYLRMENGALTIVACCCGETSTAALKHVLSTSDLDLDVAIAANAKSIVSKLRQQPNVLIVSEADMDQRSVDEVALLPESRLLLIGRPHDRAIFAEVHFPPALHAHVLVPHGCIHGRSWFDDTWLRYCEQGAASFVSSTRLGIERDDIYLALRVLLLRQESQDEAANGLTRETADLREDWALSDGDVDWLRTQGLQPPASQADCQSLVVKIAGLSDSDCGGRLPKQRRLYVLLAYMVRMLQNDPSTDSAFFDGMKGLYESIHRDYVPLIMKWRIVDEGRRSLILSTVYGKHLQFSSTRIQLTRSSWGEPLQRTVHYSRQAPSFPSDEAEGVSQKYIEMDWLHDMEELMRFRVQNGNLQVPDSSPALKQFKDFVSFKTHTNSIWSNVLPRHRWLIRRLVSDATASDSAPEGVPPHCSLQHAIESDDYKKWRLVNRTTMDKTEEKRKSVKRCTKPQTCHTCRIQISPGPAEQWWSKYKVATYGEGSHFEPLSLYFHKSCCPATSPFIYEEALKNRADYPACENQPGLALRLYLVKRKILSDPYSTQQPAAGCTVS